MKVSWCKNKYSAVSKDFAAAGIIEIIRGKGFQKQIASCWRIVRQHGKKHTNYESRKNNLPLFTPSGTFEKERKTENLREYSQMMMLDIDDLENEDEVLEIKNLARQCPYTWAAFVSPSGIGLKIWVKVANSAFEHKPAYQKLLLLYENFLRVEVDKSTSDVARACFISHDPNLFLNETADVFDFKTPQPLNSPRLMTAKDIEGSIKFCIEFTERIVAFDDGNRNNFVFRLACNLNRYGVPAGEAEAVLVSKYAGAGFSESEIMRSVKSAYKNTLEHGKHSHKGKSTKSPAQSFDRAARVSVYRELGISPEKIMAENDFAKALLYASFIDDDGESLLRFACSNLAVLLPTFSDSASTKILEMLLLRKMRSEADFKNHTSPEVQGLALEVLDGGWLPPETYICRIEICRFKVSKCAEILRQAALENRFIAQSGIGRSLRGLENLHSSREIWLKELDALLQDWKFHHRF